MKRGGSLSFLVGTISNVLVMEIGWTDVGSGGYILVRAVLTVILVLIVGDNMLTALSVARECGMVDKPDHIIMVECVMPTDNDADNSQPHVEFVYAEDRNKPVEEISTDMVRY